nr:olfactory receptor 14J1-like [Anser cygnoides]
MDNEVLQQCVALEDTCEVEVQDTVGLLGYKRRIYCLTVSLLISLSHCLTIDVTVYVIDKDIKHYWSEDTPLSVPDEGQQMPNSSSAICKPLHYGTLLGSRACAQMAAAAWGSGFLNAVLHTANTFSMPLCHGNAVDQFFCEVPQILKLSCSESDYSREAGIIAFSLCLIFVCFVFIVLSYVQIFKAVLRMPSEQGRHKAFSTCLPHLAVVFLFVSTAMFAHLKPPYISFPSLDLVVSLIYSVVPPAVNPLIYSMRNQELRDSLRNLKP